MTNSDRNPHKRSEVNEHEFNPYPNPDAETAALGTHLGQLHREVSRVRRAFADLVAACRAALLAERDAEPDPWAYIRDELPPAPPGHPLHHPDNGADSSVGGGR